LGIVKIYADSHALVALFPGMAAIEDTAGRDGAGNGR
jgi:hypothetical protein